MVLYANAHLDASFAALSDITRRGVLEQLGRAEASITDLAEKFNMTLTGIGEADAMGETSGQLDELLVALGASGGRS